MHCQYVGLEPVGLIYPRWYYYNIYNIQAITQTKVGNFNKDLSIK